LKAGGRAIIGTESIRPIAMESIAVDRSVNQEPVEMGDVQVEMGMARETDAEDQAQRDGDAEPGIEIDGAAEDDGREDEGEEGRVARQIPAPMKVSDREREEHELTHTPYRAWCPYCVRARGKNTAHMKNKDKQRDREEGVPRISMDYFFMSQEDEKASENPILVMVDERTGEKYARAVGMKGLGRNHEMDWLIKDLSNELKIWGYPGGPEGRIILKSDGEPAIVAVRDALAKYHGGVVIPEGPAVGESQSNGLVEEAGKTVREFVRVMKEQVEDKAEISIDSADVVIHWMIRWAAMMVSRYMVGKDGRTGFERRRGRPCRTPVACFGESIWFKQVRETKARQNKLESEWQRGVWLGQSRSSNETIVGTRDGVVRAYAIKRQAPDQRWNGADIKAMQGTPQRPDPNRGELTIPIKVRFDPPIPDSEVPTEPLRREPGMRRMKITTSMLDKYGYSEGCEGCRCKAAGLPQKPHNEKCRDRIVEAMEADDEGRERRRQATERENQRLAEELEKELGDPNKEEETLGDAPKVSKEMRTAEPVQAESASSSSHQATAGTTEVGQVVREKRAIEKEEGNAKRARRDDGDDQQDVPGEDRMGDDLNSMGIKVMNITNRYDLRRVRERDRLEQEIKDKKPDMIVGGASDDLHGAGQNFLNKIYREQAAQGKWFVHMQPQLRTGGAIRILREVGGRGNLETGLAKHGMKTVRTVTNCTDAWRRLNYYKEHGKLQDLEGSIVAGLRDEIMMKKCGLQKLAMVDAHTKVDNGHHGPEHEDEDRGGHQAWDDVTGMTLDPKEVRKARLVELSYVHEKNVWVRIPRSEAEANGFKVVKGRWIDVNKGDEEHPKYRSRYVAKEYNTGEEDGLFASTPPLEALRLLLSDAATVEPGKDEKVVMINDVARAFFEAPAKRNLCVELPEEERREGLDEVGLLQQSLYGTRDASANFQEEIRRVLTRAGFRRGKYNPSTYSHEGKGVKAMVHGDDFISVGSRKALAWFRTILEGRFEISTVVVGTRQDLEEVNETKVLNRIIRVDGVGWHYEADQRHAEYIVKALNLEGAKAVQTPGEEERPWLEEAGRVELDPKEASQFRALAARANYLALDRPDIQYATKEVCRGMSRPAREDLRRLRRIGRYLVGRPRSVWDFKYQQYIQELSGYTDSDWAGCRKTAKSTSGGAIMRGAHTLKTWSATQKNITLSSGEAELVAMVKMTSEAIGMTQLAGEWEIEMKANMYADSSAALGVVKRRGCGKLRHVKIGMLWIQERNESGEVQYTKVRGTDNPGDLMTKNVPMAILDKMTGILGQRFLHGRAEHSLHL